MHKVHIHYQFESKSKNQPHEKSKKEKVEQNIQNITWVIVFIVFVKQSNVSLLVLNLLLFC